MLQPLLMLSSLTLLLWPGLNLSGVPSLFMDTIHFMDDHQWEVQDYEQAHELGNCGLFCLFNLSESRWIATSFFERPFSRSIWKQVCYPCCIPELQHSRANKISWIVGKLWKNLFTTHNTSRKIAWSAMVHCMAVVELQGFYRHS